MLGRCTHTIIKGYGYQLQARPRGRIPRPEEVILPTIHRDKEAVSSRTVPFAAKRLAQLLVKLIDEYESRYGKMDLAGGGQ